MNKSALISIGIAIAAVIVFGCVAFTMSSVWLFVPAVIISLVIFFAKFHRKPFDPASILPVYLLALAIQLLHFTEEYLKDFTTKLPALMSEDPYPEQFWIIFNMVAYSIFILGGIVLYKRMEAFLIIPIFFLLVGVILNSIGHILLSIFTGGYFPGLFTALIYVILIPSSAKFLITHTQNANPITPTS